MIHEVSKFSNIGDLKQAYKATRKENTEVRHSFKKELFHKVIQNIHNNKLLKKLYLRVFDLTNADLRGIILTDSELKDDTLTDINIRGSMRTPTELDELTHAQLINVIFKGDKYIGAKLQNIDLTNAKLTNAKLTNANLTNANLTNANLTNTDLTKSILIGSIFHGATLKGTNFTGMNLKKIP